MSLSAKAVSISFADLRNNTILITKMIMITAIMPIMAHNKISICSPYYFKSFFLNAIIPQRLAVTVIIIEKIIFKTGCVISVLTIKIP